MTGAGSSTAITACPECEGEMDDLGGDMAVHRSEFSPCVLKGHGIRCPHGPVIYHDEGMPYCPDCDGDTDPEPQPEDGPDYYADHAAWRARNGSPDPAPERQTAGASS